MHTLLCVTTLSPFSSHAYIPDDTLICNVLLLPHCRMKNRIGPATCGHGATVPDNHYASCSKDQTAVAFIKTASGVPVLPPDWFCAPAWNTAGKHKCILEAVSACAQQMIASSP
jgi:hypothetical protein